MSGCVIPAALAVYETIQIIAAGASAAIALAVAVAVNIAFCFATARPAPGLGIVMPIGIPAAAALCALLLAPMETAVYGEHAAGDETGVLRREEGHASGDFVRGGQAVHRDASV